MYMKTNKKMTICPHQKAKVLRKCVLCVRHFVPKQTYFAGTVSSFATIRALGN
jgi:hypothetical protein